MTGLTLGRNLDRDLTNVEVVEITDAKMTFRFNVNSTTSEKYIREKVFGENNNDFVIYINTDMDDKDKVVSTPYYGYTKIESLKFEEVDDLRYVVITLRKPTLNEFISDVYREMEQFLGSQTNLTMNVGGSFVDMANDNMLMMLSQLGGQ